LAVLNLHGSYRMALLKPPGSMCTLAKKL
jgi:hypothetical protein